MKDRASYKPKAPPYSPRKPSAATHTRAMAGTIQHQSAPPSKGRSMPPPEAKALAKKLHACGLELSSVLEILADPRRGVESIIVLERLRALGCDLAQGFYLSRAISADELLKWGRGNEATAADPSGRRPGFSAVG